jgi:hypothetical protein
MISISPPSRSNCVSNAELSRRVSHPYCFQQLGDGRVSRPGKEISIAGYSCRGFDDKVEVVTELPAIPCSAFRMFPLCEF